MARTKGAADRLTVTPEQRPGLDELLALLGVDELAITDTPPTESRQRYTVELYPGERDALDDAAVTLGVSSKSGAKLCRAIIRSWLASAAQHPQALREADLGDGVGWDDAVADMREGAAWPAGATGDVARLVSQLLRLEPEDLAAVAAWLVERLPDDLADALRRAIS